VFSERAGHGAIFELSRILTAFHETLREPNMTFSVGLSAGGENLKVTAGGEASVTGKSNIIPESAMARGDLRVLSPEQYDRVTTKMHSIVANNNLPGTHSEIVIDQGYPAMAPTEGNRALFNLRNQANRALGFAEELELNPMDRGAGDISFVAPYVDSLSGLGANGSGSHAPGEAVELDTLPRQAKRAAILIHRLTQTPR
jgi:glutamate carboxypeptidase